ncbi:MAG: DUF4838 domain-containing protein [Armatimonadetes bacterium]|nr:DUF4838 domain-containing protein [Armatimonadota bacterium]
MRYYKTLRTILIVLSAGLGARAAAQPFVVVRDGSPATTIVVADVRSEKTGEAAADLQRCIEAMSGAKLPIVEDNQPLSGSAILVGRSKATLAWDSRIPSGVTSARREEGFVIFCTPERLVLAGNDADPYHGTEYAVYEFLNRLGVRWYAPGEFGEYIPRHRSVSFEPTAIVERPDFVMRNWWCHTPPKYTEQEKRWKIRNKMNPDDIFKIPTDSSIRDLLPEGDEAKAHPELFAENQDGSLNFHMPSLTNPDAARAVAEKIKDYFRQHPGRTSFAFAPDDGMPRDWGPQARKLNQGFTDPIGRPGVPSEVSISEEWFQFVNRVIEEVRSEFPDVYIATNGYANRTLPPRGVKLNDHEVIMFAAIWSCTIHAFDDPHCWQKERMGEMIRQWCALSDNVWLYGYIDNMLASALTPVPEVRKLKRDIPFLKKAGLIGFHDEARSVWAEPGVLSRYVRAKLEWNASADVDAVCDDFYENWYGKAAPAGRSFYDTLEAALEKTDVHGHEDRVLPEVYTPSLMRALAVSLGRAERLADTERDQLHVRVDRLIYEHLKAYMTMCRSEALCDFRKAADGARRMLALRKELNAINGLLMPEQESPYAYWGLPDRLKYYEDMADAMSGKAGPVVAYLPEKALLRTDERDDGLIQEWYKSEISERGWRPVSTTSPFYLQGYLDSRGFPYTGALWYRTKVTVPELPAGRRVYLYAPVLETEGWVWVNGQYAGHRPYKDAYERPAEMRLDVTDLLKQGENEIAVRIHTGLAPAQTAAGLQGRLALIAGAQ